LQQRFGSGAARRGINFRFFGEVVGELRRVTWPTMNETLRLTLMVLAVSVVIGVILGIADLIFGWGFGFILD
jgi:preprotein translocase subunit SecE|tara:strand:- start:109 stop:324 length:216 start_codon:yes stop_codon:yes gene_type:complete